MNLNKTWIPNVEGKLRDLYIAEINKQGLKSASGVEVTESWAEKGYDCLEVAANCVYFPPYKSLGHDSHELTLEDFKVVGTKPNTKVEYVFVGDFSFSLKDDFLMEKLYKQYNQEVYQLITEEEGVVDAISEGALYLKVETEIDWHSELDSFLCSSDISAYSIEDGKGVKLTGWLRDEDFLEMCRVVVDAVEGSNG